MSTHPFIELAEAHADANNNVYQSLDFEISRSSRIHESDHFGRVGSQIKGMTHRPGLNPYAPSHWPLFDVPPKKTLHFKVK